MTNRLGYLVGYRAGSVRIPDSDTDSGTDSSHVRAIASRPVPSLPDLSRPNPGAIPQNRDKQLNGNNRLSAVDAEVASAREPEISRLEAMRIASEMYAGGWRLAQIKRYLEQRGQRAGFTTIKRWADPEFVKANNAQRAAYERRRYREQHNPTTFRVLDDDARARLAEVVGQPLPDTPPAFDIDLMLALRVEDGLSYTAIAKVASRIYGQKLSEGQVRDRLNKRGVPKNPAKVRSACNFHKAAE